MKILSTILILIGFMSITTKESSNSINLSVINDYYEGLHLSKETNKPIFLYFTGVTCETPKIVNELIEKDSELIDQLNNSFVPVILHVDDRTKLQNEKKVFRDGKEITIRTKGSEWAHIEITKYDNNVQPLMVIINSDEEILKQPLIGKVTKTEILTYLNL